LPTRSEGKPFGIYIDRHLVAYVSGVLDVDAAPRLALELDPLTLDGGVVCVDFSDLEFCGAAGVRVLFGAVRALAGRGRLVIYDPSPIVARAMHVAGLDQVVDVAVGRVITTTQSSSSTDGNRSSARSTAVAGTVASQVDENGPT
jgi:anti-anti-sigma factor